MEIENRFNQTDYQFEEEINLIPPTVWFLYSKFGSVSLPTINNTKRNGVRHKSYTDLFIYSYVRLIKSTYLYASTEHFKINFFLSIEMGKNPIVSDVISCGILEKFYSKDLARFFYTRKKIMCLAIRVFPAYKYSI